MQEQNKQFETEYLNNVDKALSLAMKYIHTPPESQTKNLVDQLTKYKTIWNSKDNFNQDYTDHINQMIKWAVKYWEDNKIAPKSEMLNKSLVLNFSIGILSLNYLVQQDMNNNCLTPDQAAEVIKILKKHNQPYIKR